jgi:hypothetical protein
MIEHIKHGDDGKPAILRRLIERRRAIEILGVDRSTLVEKERDHLHLSGYRRARERLGAQAVARIERSALVEQLASKVGADLVGGREQSRVDFDRGRIALDLLEALLLAAADFRVGESGCCG